MQTKTKVIIGAVAALALIGMFNSNSDRPTTPTASTSAARTMAAAPVSAPAATGAATTSATVGVSLNLGRVIDGDTLELADGQRVRVLGIDSCEMGTYGGDEAKSMAESTLTNEYNAPFTLVAEPGAPDKDKNGRLLRYITMNGGKFDFGESMVSYDHTGVYQGKNDASPEYVQSLLAKDTEYSTKPPSGRECGNPYPSTSSGGSDVDVPDVDVPNLPDGALTGGYCARKWWC